MAVYTNRDAQTITTAAEVGRGGEGVIYRVEGRNDLVAKIYHPALRTYTRQAKLTAMVTQPPPDGYRTLAPPHVALAWPTDLLFEADAFAGFLMPHIERSPNLIALFNPQLRHQRYPHVDHRFLYRSAQNLATVLAALHSRGHVVGDLNQKNILVKGNALVTLVDTDSFQIRDRYDHCFRCGVGVPDYTPPELQGQALGTIDRQPYHDCFGLSVLLFQLLMEGYHPFTGRPLTPALREIDQLSLHCMQQGWFPYSNNRAVQPPPAAPPFTWLTPEIRRLFLQSFLVGYREPLRRPTAATWATALARAEAMLIQCARCPNHWYGNHLDECPLCQRAPVVVPVPASRPARRPVAGLGGLRHALPNHQPAAAPVLPVTQAFPVLPLWVTNVLKLLGGTVLTLIALTLLFNGYWPLVIWLFFMLRIPKIQQVVWPMLTFCCHVLMTGSQQLGRGLWRSGRWLAPRVWQGGRAAVASWMGAPSLVKQLTSIALMIAFLTAINYYSGSFSTLHQPPSPLSAPAIESPLVQPTVRR